MTEPSRFGIVDYVVFAGMLAISACIGIYYACSGQKQKTTKEFLLGDRKMKVFPVTMSVLATFVSAITLLGVPAEMYMYGTLYSMAGFSLIILLPVTAFFYMPVYHRLGITSTYEYLEIRFNRTVRSLGSAIFSIHMMIYMGIVLYAPALALSQVTGIGLWFAVLSTGLVCTFYTTIGGIKAVVWTDVFQITMVFVVIVSVLAKGATDVGGMSQVWLTGVRGQRVEFFNFDVDVTTRHTVWNLIIGAYTTWLYVFACSQSTVQRYLALPTLKAAQTAIIWTIPSVCFIFGISALAGLIIYTRYHDCDPMSTRQVTAPDQLFPLFVMETLGFLPGLPGLFVSGIFSGALSTVSSGVNSLSAVTLEDLVKTYIKPNITEEWATRVSKILALAYGLLALLLVFVAQQLGNINQAALSVAGIMGGPLLGVFTLGMFFPWANSSGSIVGLFTGMGVSFWIAMGNYLHKPFYPKAPISVDGCLDLYQKVSNMTSLPSLAEHPGNQDVFPLYKISYMWYSVIGCLLCIIIGLIFSLLTGGRKTSHLDSRLLSPIALSLFNSLPSRIRPKLNTTFQTKEEEAKSSMEHEKSVDHPNGIANIAYVPSNANFELHKVNTSL
ncbi:sodium-coupled monocarboxylate transporter 1-like [Centruroides vittatus]|uniref:sodium-coupled monocarboxylate transporter 1-like n=1 Tax=Centruroides vittatus TaxID=120091 RepID=UPI00350F7F2E